MIMNDTFQHTYTVSGQYYLYWPHTALSVYRVCYFLVPHTHVLCMGSGSATGFFYAVRLVHSLLKYFFKFQLWYWIQIYTTKYSNLLLIILILLLVSIGEDFHMSPPLKLGLNSSKYAIMNIKHTIYCVDPIQMRTVPRNHHLTPKSWNNFQKASPFV